MVDRNRELVPDNWSQVRERAWPLDVVQEDAVVSAWVSAEHHMAVYLQKSTHAVRLGCTLAVYLH